MIRSPRKCPRPDPCPKASIPAGTTTPALRTSGGFQRGLIAKLDGPAAFGPRHLITLGPPSERWSLTSGRYPWRRRTHRYLSARVSDAKSASIAPSRANSRATSCRISTGLATRTANTRQRLRSAQTERSHCASPSRRHCPLALRFKYSMARASRAALPSRKRTSTPGGMRRYGCPVPRATRSPCRSRIPLPKTWRPCRSPSQASHTGSYP